MPELPTPIVVPAKNGSVKLIRRDEGFGLSTVQNGTASHQEPFLDRAALESLQRAIAGALETLPPGPEQIRSEKVRELYRRTSEHYRRLRYQSAIDLGWAAAERALKKLGKPVPARQGRDWDFKPGSAPGASASAGTDANPLFAAASWTGDWEIWGWEQGAYWSHRGKVPKKALDKEHGLRMAMLRDEIAKEIGLEEKP